MEPNHPNEDNSPAIKYVKSLKIALKRRFAGDYLRWIRAGRVGPGPVRGALSHTTCKAICTNIEALA